MGGVGGGQVWDVRVDVNGELKFRILYFFFFYFFFGGEGVGRSGWGGSDCGGGVRMDGRFCGNSFFGGSGWGVRVDVNEELKLL